MLLIAIAILYAFFTLLPNSHALIVSWPWVFIWQVAWVLPVIWLALQLWQNPTPLKLRNGLDVVAGLSGLAVVSSSIFSQFPNQARWYGCIALCGISALYALVYWLRTYQYQHKLLTFQASLSACFIGSSLVLWLLNLVLPEIAKNHALKKLGIEISFTLQQINLQNWYPIGHQNYVAGYLVLNLPILFWLGCSTKAGVQRQIWFFSFALGLADLYSTGSRGGFVTVGIWATVTAIYMLWLARLSWRIKVAIGLLFSGVLGLFILTNARLLATLTALFSNGSQGELSYRLITNLAGWQMGLANALTGLGIGSVPLTYQKYRPAWAGREAEMVFQLHSTPAQLFAELGILGIVIPVCAIIIITYLSCRHLQVRHLQPTPLVANEPLPNYSSPSLGLALWSSLLSYGIYSLTDYQLDVPCISATIIVITALFIVEVQRREAPTPHIFTKQTTQRSKAIACAVAGAVFVIGLWLIPIHYAWSLSSEGFIALRNNNFPLFESRLQKAHHLAKWEPYYTQQLAWNLGNASLQANTPDQQAQLEARSRQWFQKALEASPYQEFSFSNDGWMSVATAPEVATNLFLQSAQLVPAKKGTFFGLGYSLLLQNKKQLALQAFLIEALQNPVFITSPIWNTSTFQEIYPQLLSDLESQLNIFLQESPSPFLRQYWLQTRGGVRWWGGNLQGALADWEASDSQLGKMIYRLSTNDISLSQIQALPLTSASLIAQAWLSPNIRESLLQKLPQVQQSTADEPEANGLPRDVIQEIAESLNQAQSSGQSFDSWIKTLAPHRLIRSQRAGFNTLSRHTDGPTPEDFFPRWENIPLTYFFADLFPSVIYQPELDILLMPLHTALVSQFPQQQATLDGIE